VCNSADENADGCINTEDIHVSHSLIEGRDGEATDHNSETHTETDWGIDGGMIGVAIVIKTIHVFACWHDGRPALKIYSTRLRRASLPCRNVSGVL